MGLIGNTKIAGNWLVGTRAQTGSRMVLGRGLVEKLSDWKQARHAAHILLVGLAEMRDQLPLLKDRENPKSQRIQSPVDVQGMVVGLGPVPACVVHTNHHEGQTNRRKELRMPHERVWAPRDQDITNMPIQKRATSTKRNR